MWLAASFGRRLSALPPLHDALDRLARELPFVHVAALALSLLRARVRERFTRLVPELVAADPSFAVLSIVAGHLSSRRQDLLDPFLGDRPMTGRFATGRTHWVMDFGRGHNLWTSRQQGIYAAALRTLLDEPKRDVPTLRFAIGALAGLSFAPRDALTPYASDPRPQVREMAIRALPWLDGGQGVVTLLECLGDDRARWAISALRRAFAEMTRERVLAILRGAPKSKVTVAKEVVRRLGDMADEGAYRDLLSMDAPGLHRDVRIALLRALWPHLERDPTWAVFERAAADPDWVVASRLADVPLVRLSDRAEERVTHLLSTVLARPEPEARLDLLGRAAHVPLRDARRGLFARLVQHMGVDIPDEATAACRAVLARMLPGEVGTVVARVRGPRPRRCRPRSARRHRRAHLLLRGLRVGRHVQLTPAGRRTAGSPARAAASRGSLRRRSPSGAGARQLARCRERAGVGDLSYVSPMTFRPPIGYSDFAQLRREGLTYVDKTGLAVGTVRSNAQALLLPRPRRFGKTLNLTMLRYFFERTEEDRSALFEGLAVASAGEDVAARFQRHPVVFVTFKDCKHRTWEDCAEHLRLLLRSEADRLRPLWDVDTTTADDRVRLEEIATGQASVVAVQDLLKLLSPALAAATGEEVVLLIDEYDTPIHAGFSAGYYDDAVTFFRNFLSAGLEDNSYLYRAVMTGILRVAKESIFSGLNNVAVYTMLSPELSEHFGFTEAEVEALARLAGKEEELPTLRAWYNGYRFGSHLVYNPWSVLNQLGRGLPTPQPWWLNTASDEVLRELLIGGGLGLQDDLSALLRGEVVRPPVAESIVLRDVRNDADAVWSFLLFSGYLTPDDPLARDPRGLPVLALRIPNHEVSTVYRTVFAAWMRQALAGRSDAPERLGRAVLSGDAETFELLLEELILRSMSIFDLGARAPEAVYQAFVVGLLVHLEASHDVRSNRESGLGRYDVMVRPRQPGSAGAVLELKVLDPRRKRRTKVALDDAMQQVKDKRYAVELHAAGAEPVWLWAAVFDGKRVWVRTEQG